MHPAEPADHPAPSGPAASSPDVDAIVAALGRIRPRRGPRMGGPHGDHDGHRHAQGSDTTPAQAPGGSRGPGGRFGGPALLRLLSQLAHAPHPLSISELAEQVEVDQPRASRLVQQAVERGFAAREADPEDARRTRVRITELGEQTVHGFRGRQRADVTTALTALDPAERAELARLIAKLADAWPAP